MTFFITHPDLRRLALLSFGCLLGMLLGFLADRGDGS